MIMIPSWSIHSTELVSWGPRAPPRACTCDWKIWSEIRTLSHTNTIARFAFPHVPTPCASLSVRCCRSSHPWNRKRKTKITIRRLLAQVRFIEKDSLLVSCLCRTIHSVCGWFLFRVREYKFEFAVNLYIIISQLFKIKL